MSKHKDYVCWSGGADSTAVLVRLLKLSSEDSPVHIITIAHPQLNKKQYNRERISRNKMQRIFDKRKYHYVMHYIRYPSDAKEVISTGNLNQPAWWVCQSAQLVEDNSTIHFGYIQTDVMWHIRQHFEEAYVSICKMMMKTNCKVSFPFELKTKVEVVEYLTDNKLIDNIWTCDEVKSTKPCGECHKCKELKDAIDTLNKRKDL